MTASLVGPGGQIDVSDREDRLLGHVIIDGGGGGGTPGGATETTLAAVLAELTQKLEPGQVVALDAATLAALETINAVVSGSVSVSNFPANQAVSGPLTDGELRAAPVPVSFPADEAGLTDAQLRAAPVPISGTVTANLGTIDGAATETTLAALLTEMGQKLESGGVVALDGATLAALETISVANWPAVQPVNGTVGLDAAALAALETITVANPTANPETGLAKDATVLPVLKRFDSVLTAKATYTTSGDHTLIAAPASPLALRPVWFYAQAKGALDTGTVIVSFTLGARSYEFELTGSQPFAHGAVWDGAVGEALVVNTSSVAAVMVNCDYRTYQP